MLSNVLYFILLILNIINLGDCEAKNNQPKVGIKCESTGVMKYFCEDHCLPDSCHTTFDMNYCNCKNNFITKKSPLTEISNVLKLMGISDVEKLCANCNINCKKR